MKREDKESFVADFRERLRKAPVFYLTDYSGLDVKSITRLRRTLGESGAEYVVVKNRLVRRALAELELDLPEFSEHLSGPTGVIIAGGEAVGSAKALSEFAKEHEDRPVFKIGYVESRVVEAAQFQRLAKLPPRDVLLSQLAGALQAPLAELVGVLEAKLQETASVLQALHDRRQSEGS
jgi:large subunit ribosomal protein L10